MHHDFLVMKLAFDVVTSQGSVNTAAGPCSIHTIGQPKMLSRCLVTKANRNAVVAARDRLLP